MASFLKRLFGGSGGGGDAPTGEPDHATVMARARNELGMKTAAHDSLWKIGSASWAVDLEDGRITFDGEDGMRVIAPVQVIGTLDTAKGTWMWGWDHPSVPAPCAHDAGLVRDYGAARGLERLTTRLIPVDEATAWDFAALAAHLSGAQGAYRGPAGTTLVFMTFGEISLSKPSAQGDGIRAAPPEKDFGAGLEVVDAPDVLALVQGYCVAISDIERRHYDLPEDERRAAFGDAIAAQQPVYEAYWRRDDDYWRPCSVASHSDYDPASNSDWRVFARGADGFRVTYVHDIAGELKSPRAFDVARFPDGLKIVDQLF